MLKLWHPHPVRDGFVAVPAHSLRFASRQDVQKIEKTPSRDRRRNFKNHSAYAVVAISLKIERFKFMWTIDFALNCS